jgi:hypothetical protein
VSLLATGSAAGVQLASGSGGLGAGFIAFVVVVALAVASYVLFRSMTRHLRKVPPTFEQPPPAPDDKPRP